MKWNAILVMLCITLSSCGNDPKYYEKHVRFLDGASLEQKVEMASRLVPTPGQKAWQELELTAFLHFGLNTFSGMEWGTGQESPELFNPTALDAEQWIGRLKEGGFKMAIITAKHHDGFCLWPTQTTSYSVAASSWLNGKGDVVKAVKDACDLHGLKFGIYISPWDRNAAVYGTPEYNDLYVAQLTELLTNYGTVHEVWFDGACGEGPNGKKQEYDWKTFHEVIRRLQPEAVTAIMGDDVRWVGNEDGLGRPMEWSATVCSPPWYSEPQQSSSKTDLGSREQLKVASQLFWYPSEVDVSIRPSWFYHAQEDNKVKPLTKLVDIYFESVGYNSVLLLNVPPDRRGLIHENDAARLKELGDYIRTSFADNRIKSSEPTELKQSAVKEFALKDESEINVLLFQEDIGKGQRMEDFSVEAMINGQWTEIAAGSTIGHKRLIRIPVVTTSKIRLKVNQCRSTVHLSNVGAYYAEPLDIPELNRVEE